MSVLVLMSAAALRRDRPEQQYSGPSARLTQG